jgi:polysaccharide export outer membrane protein
VAPTGSTTATPAASAAITPPADYVIGPGDVLIITYWRDKDMTSDAVVRPDGKITLPLLNDVDASGLTPEQLRDRLLKISVKYLEDPNITVGVKAINSRRVYITGGINKPGPYDLAGPMDVMSLISMAGGLRDFVNGKRILILRTEGSKQTAIRFNYREVEEGKNLQQNIPLKPGDRIVVPD